MSDDSLPKLRERDRETFRLDREQDEQVLFLSGRANRDRILFLISLYSHPPAEKGAQGVWIRKPALAVLIYEGVVGEVLDLDYAPQSAFLSDSRAFINVSQEGEEYLHRLLVEGMVHNLKLSTTRHRFVTAYQITPGGVEAARGVSPDDARSVLELVSCPECNALLMVRRVDGPFYLHCPQCRYRRKSTVTDIEDVSYFSVPFLPGSAARRARPSPESLARRLQEYYDRKPTDNIRDQLEEIIFLSDVRLLVAEWIPFGSNHVAALNVKLGASERLHSAKFTQEIEDDDPEGTTVEVPESYILVDVLDHDFSRRVAFTARSYLPEDPGVVQVEEFGVHIDATGRVVYGLEILAVNDRGAEAVSLDHLPRLMIDVLQDSTSVLDTLLTSYQKDLVDLVFRGKGSSRDKFFFVLARNFWKSAGDESSMAELLRREEYEDELRQVVEEVKREVKLDEDSRLIEGTHGCILIGPDPERYESLVGETLFIRVLEIFLDNFFNALFILNDQIKDIRQLISLSEVDPNAIGKVQEKIGQISGESTQMAEILGYMEDAMRSFGEEREKSGAKIAGGTCQAATVQERLAEVFDTCGRLSDLAARIQDMRKIIQGTQETMGGLREISQVMRERQMMRIQETLSANTRNLEDMTKTSDRSRVSLKVVEIILAGSLAFSVMNQLTGDWTASQSAWFKTTIQPIQEIPGAWLFLTLLLWITFGMALMKLMGWIEERSEPVVVSRTKVNLRCNLENLNKYLQTKNVLTRDADLFPTGNYIKVSWRERRHSRWKDHAPHMEILYDEKNGFLLSYLIEVPYPRRISGMDLNRAFMTELEEWKVIDEIPAVIPDTGTRRFLAGRITTRLFRSGRESRVESRRE